MSKPDYTTASVANTDDSIHFQVYFNGNKTSEQHAGDDSKSYIGEVKFQISFKYKNGDTRSYEFMNTTDTPGDIHITKYGGVGDTIEGDFSGMLMDEGTQFVIIVKNGHFSIPRSQDQTND